MPILDAYNEVKVAINTDQHVIRGSIKNVMNAIREIFTIHSRHKA